MKIVNKKEKFAICFEDVGCGEIFEYDSIYWMKVFDCTKHIHLAVSVVDGDICGEFEPMDMCRAVKTELHILD